MPKAGWAIACRARSNWRSDSRPRPVRRHEGSIETDATADAEPIDEAAQTDRFVRRQRADALAALRTAPSNLFRPRLSRQPAVAAVVAALLLAPVLLLPNPQDAAIAQQRQVREAANQQAERLDDLAHELESKGADAKDPRTRLAQDLRDLARQLRDHPDQLDVNLARLGSVEADVRAQIDPATEQRAASLTSLSRALSRAATGKPDANKDGDPKQTQEDLDRLGEQLDEMTPEERANLARQLAEQQAAASGTNGAASTALHDAAQSLAQGDTAGAKTALDRLGDALTGTERAGHGQPRSLGCGLTTPGGAATAGRLRAHEHRPGTRSAGPGPGEPAPEGRCRPGPGPREQGRHQPGAGSGQGQGPAAGQGRVRGQGPGARPRSGPRAGAGPRAGSGPRPGAGPGARPGSGQGAIGGGGSNARSLGNGIGGNGRPAGPTNPNRPSQLGADLSSVYAPFDRLGKPGDPSYIAGTGGDGQTQQGNQTGRGSNNGALTPYQQVYADFEQYAQTSLERGYIPLSVKDYVRDYFSSLDPSK